MLLTSPLIWLLCILVLAVCKEDTACSTVGSSRQMISQSDDFASRRGLFFIKGAPSRCNGYVTTWQFRYACGTRRQSNIVLLVYRPTNNHTFNIVTESIKAVTISCSNVTIGKEHVWEERLSSFEEFLIEKGDVLAVCLPKNEEQKPIFKIFQFKSLHHNNSIPSVYKLVTNDNSIDNCALNRLQTVDSLDVRGRPSLHLNLYVNITAKTSMTSNTTTAFETSSQESNQHIVNYLEIVPASVIGLLLLITCIVIVVVIICAIKWRRKKKRESGQAANCVSNNIDDHFYLDKIQLQATRSSSNAMKMKENVAYKSFGISILNENIMCSHDSPAPYENSYESVTQEVRESQMYEPINLYSNYD